MALPTIEKTYVSDLNNTAAGNATLLIQNRQILWEMSQFMLANGWTTVSSSGWASEAGLTWATAGNTHSHIVLGNANLADGNFQFCIDLNATGSAACSFIYSLDDGFTGGTATNRPTATDEHVVLSNTSYGVPSSTNISMRYHLWQSTDGKVFRFMIGFNGNCTGHLEIQEPKQPRASWDMPVIVIFMGSTGSNQFTYGNYYDSARVFARINTVNASGTLTSEASANTALGELQVAADDLDSEWPLSPMGVYFTTSGARGRHCNVWDLWFGSTAVATSDNYPDTPPDKDLCQLGVLVVPSAGLTLQMT